MAAAVAVAAAIAVLGVPPATVASPLAAADGGWQVVPSPDTSSAEQNVLYDVACVSTYECWAVGSYFDSALGQSRTLVEAWDGASWSIASSPNVPGAVQELRSVACASSTDCWAVGTVHSSPAATLIQHWDGASWSIVGSPPPPVGQAEQLFDVTCASTARCFAVGSRRVSGEARGHPLVIEWNGARWSSVEVPTPGQTEGNLVGVTCPARSRCWAVGQHFTGDGGSTLVLRWNGRTWAVVDSPDPTTAVQSQLGDVTCLPKATCWAVGSTAEAGGGNRNNTLIERWSGGSWSLVPSADTARAENFLSGVGCLRRTDCWAVGTTQDETGAAPQALIEHWDGGSWSVVEAPIPVGSSNALLSSVTCLASQCWAVGTHRGVGPNQTLILRIG